jgi:hydrogenase nickel incorporation protein HypA/HybF
MHELSLTRAIVELCSEAAEGARVRRITIEVGKLSGVVPDALQFCYEVCTAGTLLDSSELDIVEEPARATCRTCGEQFALADVLDACACGSYDLSITAGQALRVKEMEVI